MKTAGRLLFLTLSFLLISSGLQSQILTPVKWSQSLEKTGDKSYTLIFKADIDDGWKIYANDIEEGGPIPTGFTFDTLLNLTPKGPLQQLGRKKEKEDHFFDMQLKWFENRAVFRQEFELDGDQGEIKGYLTFMTCDATQCLPPEEIPFHYQITKGEITSLVGAETSSTPDETVGTDETATQTDQATEEEASDKSGKKRKSLWGFLLAGFGSGLLALLTPCVFPMIPLTVSFFTKSSKNRKRGLANALIYALSIIGIFLILGFLITLTLGPGALNAMASNKYFNLMFFVVFVIFAISFFGAFEITLPSSFINRADAMSDKGGIIGIFFMAFTLVLVSFSCTAPIVGSMLVLIADSGEFWAPMMGLMGFALALAIPFALFAAFPGWLNSLPKSGGWLNTVKVTLGFAELALAMKFLSVADLSYHWNFLTRDIFLSVWIVIAFLLGTYLLGKLQFKGEPAPKLTVTRLFFAIFSFAFAVYLLPGLWGAPVKLMSGIAPPQHYQEFQLDNLKYKLKNIESHLKKLEGNTATGESPENESLWIPEDIVNVGHCPHELNCYFDLDRGLAAAKRENKPILLDFTGWSCVNCRKMEDFVWSDPRVWELINNDYILVSLYVDDKTPLPKEFRVSKYTGNKVSSVGKLWSDLQRDRYQVNSQPYYVLLDHHLNKLAEPIGYTPDKDRYLQYLKDGLSTFRK